MNYGFGDCLKDLLFSSWEGFLFTGLMLFVAALAVYSFAPVISNLFRKGPK